MADARIADIAEPDLPDVAAFLARQSPPPGGPAPDADSALRRLRWLLLDNPARLPDAPFGWCLRAADAGRVVGAMLCVPWRLGHAGSPFTALMSCKFFVDEPYRGMGLGLFTRYLKLGARLGCPLFGTTANRASGELWERFGGYPIPGTDHEMIAVARLRPVAEEWTYRRLGGRRALARLAAAPAWLAGAGLRRRSFQASHDDGALTGDPEAPGAPFGGAVTSWRDADYLRWRYRAAPEKPEVLRYELRGEPDRLVVAGVVRRGYRGQIRALTVLDVWPPTSGRSAPQLARSVYSSGAWPFDVLAVRSQPPEAEAALAAAGFRRHAYPAPLGWCIDRHRPLPTREWYLMPGEAE